MPIYLVHAMVFFASWDILRVRWFSKRWALMVYGEAGEDRASSVEEFVHGVVFCALCFAV